MIIDTHLHLIDKSALSYPWLSGVPALDRDFLYEEYAQLALRAGISSALHMEVDVDPSQVDDETGYVERLSETSGNIIRGAIASCRPEDTGFAEHLESQLQNPFVKGFRRILHVEPDELSESTLFHDNIKRMEGTGLTFDLCVLPRQIPQAIALADSAPGVQFIFDHCGVPDIKANAEQPWRGYISQIAERPNVTAKISGVIAYADAETWTVETLRPYVEHVIGSFGWDRIVWGSDWPVCTLGGGITQWVAATHALLSGCSEQERTALLSGNAKRIWKL